MIDHNEINQAYDAIKAALDKGEMPLSEQMQFLANAAPHLLLGLYRQQDQHGVSLPVSYIDMAMNSIVERGENPAFIWAKIVPFFNALGKGYYNRIIAPRLSEIGQDNMVGKIFDRLPDIVQSPNIFAQMVKIADDAGKVSQITSTHLHNYLKACSAENIESRENYTKQWTRTAYNIVTAIEAVQPHDHLTQSIAARFYSHGLARTIYQDLYDQFFEIDNNPNGTEDLFASHHQNFKEILKSHPQRTAIVQNALAIAYFHFETDLNASMKSGGTLSPKQLETMLTQQGEQLGIQVDVAAVQTIAATHQTALAQQDRKASAPAMRPPSGFSGI